jgi:glucose-1-phosphate adenylyltransferase
MDLLGYPPVFELNDPNWRIYTRNPVKPPHYVGEEAYVRNALVSEGCVVEGAVENSILFAGAIVEKGARVKDCVIMPNACIGANCDLNKAIVGENTRIGAYTVIGGPLRPGETVNNSLTGDITLVGNDVSVPPCSYLAKGAVVNAMSLESKEERV